MTVKLLTLNTHSLIEENAGIKRQSFARTVADVRPDVIALQEVNQSVDAPLVPYEQLDGYLPCHACVPLRADNHALAVVEALKAHGVTYHWSYLPIKRGYGIYDEGVALLFRNPAREFDILTVSRRDDYESWKTRKILGAKVDDVWFYSLHLGWWDDREEPFAAQWRRLHAHMRKRDRVFLMGDFNSPSDLRGEGYDLVLSDGWIDTHTAARQQSGRVTIPGAVAGWTERALSNGGARVDYIFCNFPCSSLSSRVIFDGNDTPTVSDHFGLICQIEM